MKLQNGAEVDGQRQSEEEEEHSCFNETSDIHHPCSAEFCCINFHRLSHMHLKEQQWSLGNETRPN